MRERRLVRALLGASLLLGVAVVSIQVRAARSIRTVRDPGRTSGSKSAPATDPGASAPAFRARGPTQGDLEIGSAAGDVLTQDRPPAPRVSRPESASRPSAPADDRDGPPAGIENRFDANAVDPRPGQGGLFFGATAPSAVPRPPLSDAQKSPGPAAAGSAGGSGGGSGGGTVGAPPLTLALAPAPADRSPGDRLRIQVVLSGAQEVTSVPLHVRFDPDVLEFLGATKGSALEEGRLQPILLASVNPHRPGDLAVGLALVGASGTFSGSGTLILLEFRALRTGRTELALDQASVRGMTGEPLPARIEGVGVEVR